MFWGVTILGGRRYTQTVERSYHISRAVLDVPIDGKSSGNKRVQLMLEHDKSNYLLCNLDSEKCNQVALDLIFTEGEEVTFYLNGEGTVHITGYVLEFDGESDFEDFDEELSEESETEAITNDNAKRLLKSDSVENANSKKIKVDISPKKNGVGGDNEEDEDDDDEEDEDFENALGDLDMESVDDEEDDDDDDDDDDLDDEEDDEEDEEVEKFGKPIGQKAKQINGQQKLQLPNVKTTPFKGQQQQKVQVGTPGGQNQKKFGQKGQPGSQAKQFNQNKAGTGGQQQKSPFNKQQSMNNKKPFTADQKKLSNGLQYEELYAGKGLQATEGKFVHVKYIGKLPNNKEFDRSTNKPFSFRLGAGEVIQGWDQGVAGMRVGGKRRLIIPSHLAYGSRRIGPIPANSTLHFDVELVAVS